MKLSDVNENNVVLVALVNPDRIVEIVLLDKKNFTTPVTKMMPEMAAIIAKAVPDQVKEITTIVVDLIAENQLCDLVVNIAKAVPDKVVIIADVARLAIDKDDYNIRNALMLSLAKAFPEEAVNFTLNNGFSAWAQEIAKALPEQFKLEDEEK